MILKKRKISGKYLESWIKSSNFAPHFATEGLG
jgi:hypothetical protein